MRLRQYAAPALTALTLAGVGAAAFLTRDRWVPVVFPSKPAAKPEGGHDDHAHDEPADDRVTLSEQAQANLGLDRPGAVDTLTPREYWRKIVIPGVVADWPGVSDRGVTARTAGVVAEIRARPGDVVKPGDPLFTLHLVGEFVQSAQTDLAKVAKDLAAAVARRDQTKKLVDAGTRPGADLVEEQNQVNRLTTQAQGYRRQLLVLGLTPEQVARAEAGDAVTEVAVSVPAPGPAGWFPFPAGEVTYEVQELRAVLGEQVQAGQTLCVLANHRLLFVEGRAFKSESAALAAAAERGIPIEAEFADEPPGTWPTLPPLVIHHLSNQVDAATRTFGFYLALENTARTFARDGKPRLVWRFRPGQRARLTVPVEKLADEAYVLPAGAVVREGPDAFVFVRAGDVFLRRPVRVLYDDRVEAVVARDGSVSAAEYVVRTPAAAALNRAIKAAAAGGGHDHSHEH